MQHYAKIRKKLEDKLNYIKKIKLERNLAQDQINELLNVSGYNNFVELKKFLKKYRQSV